MKIITKQNLIAFAISLLASASMFAQFEESAKIVSDVRQDYAEFGTSVDILNNFAVVGASREDIASGAAYIYEKDEFGNWELIQSLEAFDSNPMAEYGGGIKISQDYLVVASGRADIEGTIRAGALYVYENDGTNNWEYTTKLIASDYSGDAKLGMNPTGLDLQGSTIVCGAPGEDSWTGSFYIFENEGGVWSEIQKVTLEDAENFEAFGISVAISGDYIVAGANESDGFVGSAYIYKKDAEGVWNHLQEINASDGTGGDLFGTSVSIDGDYIVVGAVGDITTTGAAYIFKKDSLDVWTEVQKITASSPSEYAHFGWACEIDGDKIVVSSPHLDDPPNLSEIHVFIMDEEGVWNESQQIQSSDISAEDAFGWSVAMHNGQLIVGAATEDDDENGENALIRSGSAYIFEDPSFVDAISENHLNRTFSIYPVPASDKLSIETSGEEISEILLINQLGKTVLSEKVSFADYYSLDLSAISEGIYFVKLIYANGQTATMKMLKRN